MFFFLNFCITSGVLSDVGVIRSINSSRVIESLFAVEKVGPGVGDRNVNSSLLLPSRCLFSNKEDCFFCRNEKRKM
jgi:hypothetical protein